METVAEYQERLEQKTADLTGFAQELAKQYIWLETKNYDGYIYTKTIEEFKRLIQTSKAKTITELFDLGLFKLVVAIVGKEKAPEIQEMCEALKDQQFQYGIYRRSYHTLDPIRHHAESIIYLLYKMELNVQQDILKIGRNLHQYDINGYCYTVCTDKKTKEVKTTTVYLEAKLALELTKNNPQALELIDDYLFSENNTMLNRSILIAIIKSGNPVCLESPSKLLLAAQRQEGLRQSILEAADSGSVETLLFFMKLIRENDLIRFSAVQRAVSTWTGLGYNVEDKKVIVKLLDLSYEALVNPELIDSYIASEDMIQNYAGLWAAATRNHEETVPYIEKLVTQKKHQQLSALYFLMGFDQSEFQFQLVEQLILTTDDLDVLTFAMQHVVSQRVYLNQNSDSNQRFTKFLENNNYVKTISPEFYQRLESLLEATNGKTYEVVGKPFPWIAIALTQESIYERLILIAKAQENQIWLEHLMNQGSKMTPENRSYLLFLECSPPKTVRSREFLFEALKDRSSSNRDTALKIIKELQLTPEELVKIEDMLALKSGVIRQASLEILQKSSAHQINEIIERLLTDKKQEKRLGGLDLILQLKNNQQLTSEEIPQLISYIQKPTAKELKLIDGFQIQEAFRYSRSNGFGLYQAEYPTPNIPALATDANGTLKQFFAFDVKKLSAKLKSLSDLIHQHREYEYESIIIRTKEKISEILGSDDGIGILYEKYDEHAATKSILNYPLGEIWLEWMKAENITLLELVQLDFCDGDNYYRFLSWKEGLTKEALKEVGLFFDLDKMEAINILAADLPYINTIRKILDSIYLELKATDIQLNSKTISPFELFYRLKCEVLASIPVEKWIHNPCVFRENHYRNEIYDYSNISFIRNLSYYLKNSVETAKDFANLVAIRQEETFRAQVKLDQEGKQEQTGFVGMTLADFGRALDENLLPKDALFKELFLPKRRVTIVSDLLNPRWNKEAFKNYPALKEFKTIFSERVLEIELTRGDSKTEVSYLANQVKEVYGVDHFIDIIASLEGEKLVRGYISGHSYTKREIFSSLLKSTRPKETDTVADLKANLKRYKITEQQLIEAMLYNPRWIELVSDYLGWKGLKSTAWYFTAHSSDYRSQFELDQIGRYSEIENDDFQEGAFDVRWFNEAYREIGKKRFEQIYDSAKYTSDGSKHRRSQLYADASLGKLKLKPLLAEVADKRNKDKLRSLGLIPLNKRNPVKDAWQRYNYLQKFLKESKQFGAQRRASEGKASQIALENLARNAGDGDVTRFSWRMEIFDLHELQNYFIPKEIEDAKVHLEIDDQGSASIQVEKAEKKLKSIPANLKKVPYIVELQEIRKKLKEQYRRSRKSLEQAMEKGIEFEAGELTALLQHPVIQPMLDKLVILGGKNDYVGFLSSEGIRNVEKELVELPADTLVRIAHPYDLYQSGKWRQIQHILFEEEIVQPFKQVFRELYLPNEDEKATKESKRYAGHQIQPQKTVALLKNRDWVVSYEDGLRKVYYEEDIIATLYAMADWFSPADIEAPTIEGVLFYHRKTGKRLFMEEVPPLIFSEVMRDMDLVVSVAHVGGVDPETSFSTIETRAVLVEELSNLLKLDNVHVKKHHALIKGQLAEYSLHLGSGVVHQIGGRMIPILAVQSQHRGRLFLPFVDEDPRTAEIMSKLILLSADQKIKDPMILEAIQ
ncbi:DUF5724 domain-containing protein [Carnobacterium gallinarum]|uniref:DUF4132 domain-containing protein n=1 Tax=Carnobacterium gallinarum TaxID=2749 RepID=UPI00068DCC4D|nr:DUF4132 domain-containing protein [Carnobacterium gallinarum]